MVGRTLDTPIVPSTVALEDLDWCWPIRHRVKLGDLSSPHVVHLFIAKTRFCPLAHYDRIIAYFNLIGECDGPQFIYRKAIGVGELARVDMHRTA